MNQKLKKQDKTAVDRMRLFEKQPNQDGQILKAKKIVGRDESKLTERLHDPKMRCTVYFTSAEQKGRYLEKLAAGPSWETMKKGGRAAKG